MAAQRIDGKVIAAEITAEATEGARVLRERGVVPGLAVVLVGDDPPSHSYVRAKAEACDRSGFASETRIMPESTTQDEVLAVIDELNADPRWDAILVQLPLPAHIDEHTVLNAVRPEKDVDGLHPVNLGLMLRGEIDGTLPCTPAGVIEMLLRTGNDPAGKHVVIVGRSTLVGRPLAVLLSNKARGGNATVTIAHTRTPDLGAVTRQADILVAAAGNPGTITADMVKPGAVVIDVGTNRIPDASRERGWRLVGDVEYKAVREVASWITPVPGGVGAMTIAMLLMNTLKLARRRAGGD